MTSPKGNIPILPDSSITAMDKNLDKEFKKLIIKMIKEPKEYANKQLNQIRKASMWNI
jgi:hypothetical protein